MSEMFAELESVDASIPSDFDVDEAPIEALPEIDTLDDSLRCLECGKPLTYGGRGRKPKYCAEHKPKGSTATRAAAVKVDETDYASIAAKTLASYNKMLATALIYIPGPFNLPSTGTALNAMQEPFETAAREALEAAPTLAKQIARAGGTSGIIGLMSAYAMLGVALVPIAVQEWKSKNETRS